MGIMIVLVLWGTLLIILAVVASAILWIVVTLLLRRKTWKKRSAQSAALLLPFACVLFWAVGFLGYSFMNDTLFDRDPGLGDSWYTPIPNGYKMMAIDVTDHGWIYNPKTQAYPDSVVGQNDTVADVTRLQIDGDWIAGASDSKTWDQETMRTAKIEDGFFLLNASTGKKEEFANLSDLEMKLAAHGLKLHLRNFWDVFCEYRNTWFDWAAFAIALGVPLAALVALISYVIWIRKHDSSNGLTAA